MPKGKKKGKKKSGKKGKKEKSSDNIPMSQEAEDDIFEDKEELLKEKLFKTCREIENTKSEIEKLKEENIFLDSECEKVRSETEAFSNYLNDREEHKKNNLVTLQDYHQSMVEYYNKMRIEMLSEYDTRKEELQIISMKKDKRIDNLEEEIQSYNDDMIVREEQHKEIKELENQIQNMRCEQAAELQKLKEHLITEHQKFQQESNDKINEIARVAYKEALESLSKTFKNIESDNRELRHEMLWTIKENRFLNKKQMELLEDNKNLKEQLQYAQDFASFRQIRQEKPKRLDETKRK